MCKKLAAQREVGWPFVRANNIMFHIYYTFLEPLLNCQWCSNSGVVVTHTLERILFFDLGVAVTEINTKKSVETRK